MDEDAILLNGGNLYRAIVYMLLKKESNLFKLRKLTKNIDIKKYMDDLNIEIKIEKLEGDMRKIIVSSIFAIVNNFV